MFRGQIGERVQALLEENKIIRVLVPGNSTYLIQPLDLSANKTFKVVSSQNGTAKRTDSKQMAAGSPPDAVNIDMRMSVIKEHSCQWLVSAYDHI